MLHFLGISAALSRTSSLFLFTVLAAGLALAAGSNQEPGGIDSASGSYVWQSVAIGGGGFVTGIITHPTEKGLMYARTDVGGAYRWDANAKRWVPLMDWLTVSDNNHYGVESIAVDAEDPNRVYLAAGTYTESWAPNGIILRSADRGTTWERTNVPFKMGGNDGGRDVGERLAVDPHDGRILFFGSRKNGLWKSTDRGVTWENVTGFPDAATSPAAAYTSGRLTWLVGIPFVVFNPGAKDSPTTSLFAGVATKDNSIFHSNDGGTTWETVAGQPTGLRPNHAALGSDQSLYISYGDEPGPHTMSDGAVWKYNLASGTWTDITPLKPAPGDRFGYGSVSVDAQNPLNLVATTFCRWNKKDEVFRSTDGGKSWQALLHGPGRPAAVFDSSNSPYVATMSPHWLADVKIDPFDSAHVLFTTGYGLWASHNITAADQGEAARWSFEDAGLEECVPNSLVSPPAGPSLVSVIGDFDGFRHDDLSISPPSGRHAPHMGSSNSIDFAESSPARMVRTGDSGTCGQYTDDGGATWNYFATSPKGVKQGGSVAISADGKTIVWSPDRIAPNYSNDLGTTWQPCEGLSVGCRPVADRMNPKKFYAIDRESGQIFVSADGGASFSASGAKVLGSNASLRAAPISEGDLWIGSNKGVFHSTDSGASLTKTDGPESAYRVALGKAATGKQYPALFIAGKIGSSEGIFRSDDEGQNWTEVTDLKHKFGWITTLCGDPRVYGRVYIGTSGRGILYGDIQTKVSSN